jgi:hypothetical protein
MKQPKGPINQHKAMAAGVMPPVTGNSGKTGFEKEGGAVDGKTNIKSGTSTGSQGRTSTRGSNGNY